MRCIRLGDSEVFASTIKTLRLPVLAEADDAFGIYEALLDHGVGPAESLVVLPGGEAVSADGIDVSPYLYPHVLFRKAMGLTDAAAAQRLARSARLPVIDLTGDVTSELKGRTIGQASLAVATQWASRAKGVAFGDPLVIRSQLAWHCRERRVVVFGRRRAIPVEQVVVSAYVEEHTDIADETAALAEQIGNPVLVGRQACDGDLFAWSRHGVCIQIVDPNRPPFPIVETVEHRWPPSARGPWDDEPDDATLATWADEGRGLASLIVHSGELAHNEAMLNLVDLATFTGVKLGLAVHAPRYRFAPHTWEMLAVARDRGGARGLIEPVLHTGGWGVLAECNCPTARLVEFCRSSLDEIRRIAGDAGVPRGYLAFMDSDMPTLTRTDFAISEAIASAGLQYVVSSARPGRNRVLHRTGDCVTINQTPWSICTGSPYVRVTSVEDFTLCTPKTRPGWVLGVLDAPPIAFAPGIWRDGARFMQIVDWLTKTHGLVNTTPNVIARYARLLHSRGVVPSLSAGEAR